MLANDNNELPPNIKEAADGLAEAMKTIVNTRREFYDDLKKFDVEAKATGERWKREAIENAAAGKAALKAVADRAEGREALFGAVIIGSVAVGAVVHLVQRHRGKHTERLAAERQSQLSAQAGLSR